MSDIGEEYEVEKIVVAIDGHGSTPLTAVQLLWVNLIMDALGASALPAKPPNDGLMNRRPVRKTYSGSTQTQMHLPSSMLSYSTPLSCLLLGLAAWSICDESGWNVVP
ncbi:calcium-transporting ATPase 4, plasma membrane-type-like protein, partial [Tanacetum coccineum]